MTFTFRQQLASRFSRASETYQQAARLQQQVAADALTLLKKDQQGILLDIGCGPGWNHPQLALFAEQLVAVDLSAAMLQKAASQQLPACYLQADAQQLPVQSHSINKVFSSLMLQWCMQPENVLKEISRVLGDKGQAVITTLAEGTLTELQQSTAAIDQHRHLHNFISLPALQAACQSSQSYGMQWQLISRCYQLFYPDVISLARELKAIGANQVNGRRNGLTGKAYWQNLAQHYERHRTANGLPASYQVVILKGQKHAS